jgi:hypothetical protein
MRRRRIGRAVVGTAVVAGTAGAVHHYQDKHYAEKDAEQQEEQYYDEPPPEEYAPPPEQESEPEPDMVEKLQELGELHDSGVLTDEEFAAAKQKLLDS